MYIYWFYFQEQFTQGFRELPIEPQIISQSLRRPFQEPQEDAENFHADQFSCIFGNAFEGGCRPKRWEKLVK